MKLDYAFLILQKLRENYNIFSESFAKRREKPWPEIESLILKYLKEKDKVLDLGSGAGQYFPIFQKKKVEYFGLDFSEKLVEIAKKRYPKAKFFVGDALNLPFSDNFFDKVAAIAILHHIPSDELRNRFLQEIYRVLKKEGILILTCWYLYKKPQKFAILKYNLLKLLKLSKLDFNDIIFPLGEIKNCYFHCFKKEELENLLILNKFYLLESGFLKRSNKNENLFIVAKKPL
ncbi:MAG: class I SAM-dependent methyltransferase [Minisyncoccia bacterium]